MNEDQDWYNQPAQEIAVAKNMVDVQLEMAKMQRTEICEDIGMKRNQLKRRHNATRSSAIHSMKVTVAPMFDRYVGAMTIN